MDRQLKKKVPIKFLVIFMGLFDMGLCFFGILGGFVDVGVFDLFELFRFLLKRLRLVDFFDMGIYLGRLIDNKSGESVLNFV